MNYEKEYTGIPLTILLDAGFPTNATWLKDGQRRLMEYVFDEYYKRVHMELKQCQQYIEELEEELNDKCA